MKPFESAIYEGWVRHRRFEPLSREFSYRIFMLYLDLEEIPELMKVHPLWSTRPRSPARFRRADYLAPDDVSLREAVDRMVLEHTGELPRGPVRMLTNLRYWGLVENPITLYYCFDSMAERVETVVAEVTNTPWGQRHCYVMRAGESRGVLSAIRSKEMHVSPLMAMDHQYELLFGRPGSTLPVHINSSRKGTKYFDATLKLERSAISRSSLGRLLVAYPPMSWKTTAAIHLQAAITWMSGASYHPLPPSGGLRTEPETGKICPMQSISRKSPDLPREEVA